MADRLFRVVYISTNRPEGVVRKILSPCGVIRGMYPWMVGDQHGQTHFFVEFNNSEEVQRAKALKPPIDSFGVHSVAFSKQLTTDFLSVAPPSHIPDDPTRRERSYTENTSLRDAGAPPGDRTPKRISANRKRPAVSMKRRNSFSSNSPDVPGHASYSHGISITNRAYDGGEKEPDAVSTIANMQTHGPLVCDAPIQPTARWRPVDAQRAYNDPDLFSPSYGPSSTTSSTSKETLHSAPMVPVKSEPVSDYSILSSTPPAIRSFQNAISPTQSTNHSGAPTLVLHYEGEPFACDLDALTEDLENVVSLLQQTATSAMERDKWMLVAAHYRRKHDHSSAATVISAMIDVMKSSSVGLVDDDLGPAFLMLASCYNDLRRRAQQASDTEFSKEYIAKAQGCLQKVYGTVAPLQTTTVLSASASKENVPARKTKKKPAAKQPIDNDEARVGQVQLQREVQSLRDRHTNNMAGLAEARNAKRKLQDELDHERTVRRKIESEVQAMEEELQSARRSEKSALEVCKREVLSRRSAEERVAELMELKESVRILRHELDEKERKMKELYEKEAESKGIMSNAAAMLIEFAGVDASNFLPSSPMRSKSAGTSSIDMASSGSFPRQERAGAAASPHERRDCGPKAMRLR